MAKEHGKYSFSASSSVIQRNKLRRTRINKHCIALLSVISNNGGDSLPGVQEAKYFLMDVDITIVWSYPNKRAESICFVIILTGSKLPQKHCFYSTVSIY